jgi:pimeloyl-ACP methyl ester carboxylesterase
VERDVALPTLEHRLHRHPAPRATVVFENGLGLTLETWEAVWPALSDCCQWLAYNRAGIGRSPVAPGRRDRLTCTAADDLRGLLRALDLPPPYVLVGHSLGGLYVQRYAQQYPAEVAGLVLVDALPPGLARPWAEFAWATRLGLWLFAPAPLRQEIAAIHPTGDSLLHSPGRFTGPMVRLVAQDDAPRPEGLIKDLSKGVVYAEDFGLWAMDPEVAEARMDQLYPQAERRTVRGRHRLQEQAPAEVVAAILAVLPRRPTDPAAAQPRRALTASLSSCSTVSESSQPMQASVMLWP